MNARSTLHDDLQSINDCIRIYDLTQYEKKYVGDKSIKPIVNISRTLLKTRDKIQYVLENEGMLDETF